MSIRKKLLLSCGVAILVGAGQAIGADLPPPPEPEHSCLYLRVDGGYSFHEKPDISKSVVHAPWGGNSNATGEELDDTYFIEGGLGCSVWHNFRVDGVLGYRDGADMSEAFNGLDGDVSTFYGFLNVYYDIFTWGRLTPYIGGGIGFAHHSINNISLPTNVSEGDDTDFAWNAQAGVELAVTETVSLDVGYRYTDWGDARSGADPDRLRVENIESHDIRVGLRWSFQNW